MSLAKQIGSVSKTALTNAGHMNMNNEIYARILDTTVAALHLEALAPGYKECIDREAECVNRVTKSASTAQLEAKDKERDKTLQFIYSMNGSYKVCPDETLRTPALLVDSVLRAYDKIYAKAYAEETALIDGLLLDLAMPRDIESTAAGAQTALFNLDDLGDLGDADDTSRETAECILDEETREFFAWLNYRTALPLIAKIKSAAIERVRHMRDYDALAAEGDAETLAELAVSRAVELVLGGMKEKVNVQSMKDCLEHIRKGSGR